MTPDDVWQEARPRLEALVGRRVGETDFVDDEAVDYGMPERIYVRRSSLFGLGTQAGWAPFLGDAPSWLHLNLLQCDDGRQVVSLRRGDQVSQIGTPVINVSVERLPLTIEER